MKLATSSILRTLCFFAIFFFALADCLTALNLDHDIHQLAHRSWGEREGYPGRSEALAQTPDGFLWIGSHIGLFRFDGVHFERYESRAGDQLPESLVHALLALSDGSLWIAYDGAAICVLRNGNAKCYGKVDGIPSRPAAIVQDHEGTVWANAETGVIRFDGTRWEHIGKDWNFPENVPRLTSEALFVDSHGTLWAGVNNTVLYLIQGSKRFEPTGIFAGWTASIAQAPDGTIWLADNDSYVRVISTSVSAKSAAIARCEMLTFHGTRQKCPSEDPLVVQVSAVWSLLFDRDGSLWMTTDTAGLSRVPHPERLRNQPISKTREAPQRFASSDGLSADNCAAILEDREGNIWVATRDGLDQFRDTALVAAALPTSIFHIGMAPADGGDVWIAASFKYAGRIHGDSKNVSLVAADALKPYRDPAGITWFIGRSLAQWKDGKFQIVAPSPASHFGNRGDWQIAGDKSGKLWAFSDGRGFFSLDHSGWKAWATPPEVAKQRVADMFSDSTGLVWVSTYEGNVITMDNGKVGDYSVRPDGPLLYVTAFAERAPHEIWAGGAGGLVLINKGHFRPIRPAAPDSLKDITGIVDAGPEGLWLNATNGVIHISRDEADRALRDPNYHFQWERFDSSDGLPGQPPPIGRYASTYPTAIEGTDGRIWFTATGGVAWIDPKDIQRRNTVPPPVQIERINADGKMYDPANGLRLPPNVRDLSIDYTALSLAAPEKVHFRYKLEGQDNNWREVVNDRQVQYSNLGPKNYRFRVMASNNSGVWNEQGASLDFSIAPAYYQTNWFGALCVAVFLALLWAAYQFRIQQMQQRFNAGLEARVNERIRIARELHDTLLQSFQGLLMRFQAVSNELAEGEPKQELDETIDRAARAISEGRDAVQGLRSSVAESNDLATAMGNLGKELAAGESGPPEFTMQVEGAPRDLHPILRDEVYRVAGEALRNAFRHANAHQIEVEIRYDERQFRLRVRDDGKGIDPSLLVGSGPAGHFGLRGMRERAKQVGGKLTVWSSDPQADGKLDSGTEVELTIPAARAFARHRALRRRWLAGKFASKRP